MPQYTFICPTCQKEFTRNHALPRQVKTPCCSTHCAGFQQGGRTPIPVEIRFWPRVKKAGPDECWLWQAGFNRGGYGTFTDGREKSVLAHRMSYILHHGPIPENLCVCHTCDNRPCVNPAHLFLGTRVENIADMDRKGRRAIIPGKRGMDCPTVKLTDNNVLEIRALYAKGGISQQALGDRFQVTQSAIWMIIRRVNWTHI